MKPTIGRIVHFIPPTQNVGPDSIKLVAAIVTQVNEVGPLPEGVHTDAVDTVDLATFGPTSLYFQRGIRFAEVPTPGCWSWPPRS